MRTRINNLFLLPVLIAGIVLIPTGRATAQTFTTLHSFTSTDPIAGTNTDGAGPFAGLILSGDTLYGTASGGGSSLWGTVFVVSTDGTGFRNLYSFTALSPPKSAANREVRGPMQRDVPTGLN